MADFAVKVSNMRSGGGNALAFFNIQFGYRKDNAFTPLMEARDFVLKRSRAGDLYYQPPSKPRIRNGEHQVGTDGYKIYDAIIDLYGEKGAGKDKEKWSPTKAAFALRKHILEQASTALAALGSANEGRGTAPTAAPANVTTKIDSADQAGDLLGSFGGDGDDNDYDIPF